MMTWAVECEGLTKSFGKVEAVNNMDLKLETGKIYGLLGRNGAGKTTLLNMLTTQWFPTKGNISVFGQNPYENADILEKICMVKEKNHFLQGMRVSDILEMASYFYPKWDHNYAGHLLNVFELENDKTCKKLSRGMESSLGIIIGLASRSPLTIFDEPTLGLDAANRQQFYDLIVDDYSNHPRTIIISTHLIDEVSSLFEEIIIIDRGRIRLKEETELLKQRAYYLNGSNEAVDSIAANHTVLNTDDYGKSKVTAILGEFSDEDKIIAEEAGLDISIIPVQKLFIYLTNKYKKEVSGA